MRGSLLWCGSILALGATADDPSVTIDAGKIEGGTCKNNSNTVYYKSIPYAQPPTGKLRFAPPEPFKGDYSSTLDGTKTTPACIQFQPVFPKPEKTSEDCLYLDIWTPANATKSSNLPVRVWIYGGANQGGYNAYPLYDGCNVPESDAIMVSINYRVGPLGFFALKEANFTGNQGTQDALLALQWVQDNVAAFGGDPEKVMLHGESAGGLDTFLLASLPQAPKLMSAAAIQSGPSFSAILQSSAEKAAAAFAQDLKCKKDDASCLQSKSVGDMMKAYGATLQLPNPRKFLGAATTNITTPGFNPSLDGSVIPVRPEGLALQVPSVVGTNKAEGNLFTFSIIQGGTKGPESITTDNYATFLQENFGDQAHLVNETYPISEFNSTPYPAFFAISQVFTDHEFFCPARRLLDATVAAGVPVWTYLFAHQPQCAWLAGVPDAAFKILGPTHTSEIPFVLGNTEALPPPNGTCTMSDDEKAISRFMLNAWTAMGAHQRPVTDSKLWPAYDSKQSMGLNIVNGTEAGKIDYSRCKLWDDMEKALLQNPSSGNATTASNGSSSTGSDGSGSTPTSGAARLPGYSMLASIVTTLTIAIATAY